MSSVLALSVLPAAQCFAQGASDALPEPRRKGVGALVPGEEDWSLSPLQITPDISGGIGGLARNQLSAIVLPNINAEGSVVRRFSEGRFQFKGSARATFSSKPSVGDADAVADQIRLVGGTATANLGARIGWRWNTIEAPGTLGLQARVGVQGGLQLTDVTATDELSQLAITSSGFLIGRIEAAVGLWLYWAYVGAQFSVHALGGSSSKLHSILATPSIQLLVMAPLRPLNDDNRTFYLQFAAAGPWNSIDRILTVGLGARFEPF